MRWWLIAAFLPLASRLNPRALDPVVLCCSLAGIAYATAIGGASAALSILFFVISLMTVVAGANLESLDGFMVGLTLGLLISVAIATAQLAGWSPVAQGSSPAGLFYSRGVFSETVAPVFVWWCARGRRGVGPAVLCAGPVLLSRVAILAAAVGLIYAAEIRLRHKVVLCLILAIAGAASLWVFGDGRLHSGFLRIAIWKMAAGQVTIRGHGVGWFAQAYPMLLTAHSDLLQAFVELGVGASIFVGLALYLWTRETGGIGERAAILSFAVEASVSFPLHMPTTAFLGCVLAGYLGRCSGDSRLNQSSGGMGYEGSARFS